MVEKIVTVGIFIDSVLEFSKMVMDVIKLKAGRFIRPRAGLMTTISITKSTSERSGSLHQLFHVVNPTRHWIRS